MNDFKLSSKEKQQIRTELRECLNTFCRDTLIRIWFDKTMKDDLTFARHKLQYTSDKEIIKMILDRDVPEAIKNREEHLRCFSEKRKRGKAFERKIDYSNQTYELKGWGLINQVPTPTKNIRGRIVYEKKSTVDFTGVSHGRAIAFDAKSTNETTRFDLKNVHDHQVDYLIKHQDQGGVSFLLIHFEKLDETYFMPLNFFLEYWNAWGNGGRASITYQSIYLNCEPVQSEQGIALHYLKYC